MLKRNLISIPVILLVVLLSCKNNSQPKEVSKPQISTPKKVSKPQISIQSFHDAVLNGNIEKVKVELAAGIQADIVGADGKNALMFAAFNGHSAIIKLLFENGVPINKQDNEGRTALMYASTGPFPATVNLLLDYKAAVNLIDNGEHFTALMFAASEGQFDVVKLLVEYGADTTLKDIDGDTAEDFARQNKHEKVAEYLSKQ